MSPSGVICQPAGLAKHGNDAAYMREVRFIEIRFLCAVAQTGLFWWPQSNFGTSVCINSAGCLLLQLYLCECALLPDAVFEVLSVAPEEDPSSQGCLCIQVRMWLTVDFQ